MTCPAHIGAHLRHSVWSLYRCGEEPSFVQEMPENKGWSSYDLHWEEWYFVSSLDIIHPGLPGAASGYFIHSFIKVPMLVYAEKDPWQQEWA